MNVLKKFEEVKVENEIQISDEELKFCKEQQELYQKMISQYRKVYGVIHGIKKDCDDFLASIAQDNRFQKYVFNHSWYSCQLVSIDKEMFAVESMGEAHKKFISTIIDFFTQKYNVSIEKPSFIKLLKLMNPEAPDKTIFRDGEMSYEEKMAYKEKMAQCVLAKDEYYDGIIENSLDYNMILDHIFASLDGNTFDERIEKEIIAASRAASCNRDDKKTYEIKSSRIVFNILNPYKDYWNVYNVLLNDEAYIAIVRALAFYNSDKKVCEIYPSWSNFIEDVKTEKDGIFSTHQISDTAGDKVQTFKYYKNGKFEVGFESYQAAQKFADKYLACCEIEKDHA